MAETAFLSGSVTAAPKQLECAARGGAFVQGLLGDLVHSERVARGLLSLRVDTGRPHPPEPNHSTPFRPDSGRTPAATDTTTLDPGATRRRRSRPAGRRRQRDCARIAAAHRVGRHHGRVTVTARGRSAAASSPWRSTRTEWNSTPTFTDINNYRRRGVTNSQTASAEEPRSAGALPAGWYSPGS
jgi:hypothetical protein